MQKFPNDLKNRSILFSFSFFFFFEIIRLNFCRLYKLKKFSLQSEKKERIRRIDPNDLGKNLIDLDKSHGNSQPAVNIDLTQRLAYLKIIIDRMIKNISSIDDYNTYRLIDLNSISHENMLYIYIYIYFLLVKDKKKENLFEEKRDFVIII